METLEEDDTKSKNIGLNIEAVANYNGTPIYDLNLDTITDKPWRKPGADITDYFNYGFNEETWKIYCEKQKKILSDIADGTNNSSSIPKIGTIERSVAPNGNNNQPIPPFTTSGPKTTGAPTQSVTESPIPIASINENSKYSGMGLTKKAGPPPGRKPSGTIDVIGGGTPNSPSMITSRRPPDTPDNFNSMMNQVPPGPGLPPGPFHYPPPPFGMPPPPHAGMDFHLMGPRGINPSMITSIPPSTSYPPPPILDYKMIIKRERDDDGESDKREREERDKREREERDKRDREERDRRSKRRDREERDEREKRERREREKHVKKEFRDEKDRDKRERRDKYDKRHRDDRDDRDEGKKRRTSESDSRDREERVKKEKKDRGEKERRER
ncbi:pre-mRNA 3'-end-processing factor FIP1 [Tetranychus urticae]|uniref:pre-mRNA 3'-end-processing factor FIP1 n=1 Tax=Tetranychus urticae TaxID=32264 RepID=UPI00077B895D|nr:pre-mRNA 3'-end-processing factor FIP1 [Tetranychus urticae]